MVDKENFDVDDTTVDDSYDKNIDRITINPPSFKSWNSKTIYDYSDNIIDYNTIDELEKVTQNARKALFMLTDKINKCEREEKKAKINYERAYRRAYLESTEKTETAKKARAELKCEELENEWLVYEQLKAELNRMAMSVRQELQTLQSVGNNLRQQLKG